jgi:predicted ATP-grasp superfamily ATP-dependent carboligase
MRIGAFLFDEPIPELHEPHAFAVLQPWIDVGSVGSSTVAFLESQFQAQPLGRLARPGNFFDFTRYRPSIRLVDGQRAITLPSSTITYARGQLPSSTITYARGQHGNDLIFFHLLEPHLYGETYANSILRVLRELNVKRYSLIGAMYDTVPHTRPILVSGTAYGDVKKDLPMLGVQTSEYEGPTTILVTVSQEAPGYGIEAMTLIVHLPQYTQVIEDYAGQLRVLEILTSLYEFPFDLDEIRQKAETQRRKIDQAMKKEPDVERIIHQLEAVYDAGTDKVDEKETRLGPEIEKFLREINKGFDQES